MDQKVIRVAQIIGRVAEGGVEAMIMNLYRHIDHSKVAFDFYVENTSLIINQAEIESYGGKIIIIPSYKHLFKFKKCLKENFLVNHYDIVHANMNALSFIPLSIAKQCGIKIRIAHSHSTSNKKEHIRHLIKGILRPFSKKYATHYFACSELAGRWLYGDKFYDSHRVEILKNAIDIAIFKYNEEKRKHYRTKLNIPPDAKVVGHIGRFTSVKNQPFLLEIYNEIFKKDDNVYLLLIGSGDSLNKCISIAMNRKLEKAIMIGSVDNTFDYYNVFDCFVLPSLYEGLPVVGVEAQANGLKCFFSSEVTKETKLIPETEFIDLEEGASVWAQRILDFLGNNFNRSAYQIESGYDIKNAAEKLLQLYQSYLVND